MMQAPILESSDGGGTLQAASATQVTAATPSPPPETSTLSQSAVSASTQPTGRMPLGSPAYAREERPGGETMAVAGSSSARSPEITFSEASQEWSWKAPGTWGTPLRSTRQNDGANSSCWGSCCIFFCCRGNQADTAASSPYSILEEPEASLFEPIPRQFQSDP